jgi:hypothetical protein
MCHELTHHGGREEKLNELHCFEEAQFRALAEFLSDMNAAKEYGASFLSRPHFRFTWFFIYISKTNCHHFR